MSTYSKFFFRPARGEQVETTISPAQDDAAAICGRIVDSRGDPVENALVLLFRAGGQQSDPPELTGRFITDSDGHFLFGPLDGGTLYLIKVFKNNVKLRQLEIITD